MKHLILIGLLGLFVTTAACNEAQAVPPGAPRAPALAVSVDASGYHPASLHAPAGQPTRIVFTRTSDEGCGQQVVFPSLGIRKDLPLNTAVDVDLTMPASGSVAFTCGMNMLRGSVVVQ